MLESTEEADRFTDYERRHPRAASRLLGLMGQSNDGTESDRIRMMQHMPMVAVSERTGLYCATTTKKR